MKYFTTEGTEDSEKRVGLGEGSEAKLSIYRGYGVGFRLIRSGHFLGSLLDGGRMGGNMAVD